MNILQGLRGKRSSKGGSSRGVSSTYISLLRSNLQKRLEEAAKRDGDNLIPRVHDADIAPFEHLLVEEGRQFISNIASSLHRDDALVYPQFVEARKDYADAAKQYEEMKASLGDRPVYIQMRHIVYWPIVLLMSVCEVFVNFRAFETLFQGEPTITSLMASTVLALILIFAAHSIGGALQQRRHIWWAIILTLLSVGITFGLAYLRLNYITFENASIGVLEKPELNAQMVTGFFVLFNLLFLTLAAWMAAKLHDPEATYEQRYKTFLRARAQFAEIKELRDRNQLSHLMDARDTLGLYRRSLAEYREMNLAHRKIIATPVCWAEKPPHALLTMDESIFDLHDNASGFATN